MFPHFCKIEATQNVVRSHYVKVDWLVTKHLTAQGRPDPSGGALLLSKQNLNLSSWCIWDTNNCWKLIKNEKVMGPQNKVGQELKKNFIEHYIAASSWTRQKLFFCCSVATKVQKLFVKLQVALL
jgi:hypothetical protein